MDFTVSFLVLLKGAVSGIIAGLLFMLIFIFINIKKIKEKIPLLPENFDFLADLGRIGYPSSTLRRGRIVGVQIHLIISVLLGILIAYINSFDLIILRMPIVLSLLVSLLPFLYMNLKWFPKLHHGVFGKEFNWKYTLTTTLTAHLLFGLIIGLGLWLLPW